MIMTLEFMDVLKSFAVLLTRMGSDIWKDEGPEYAHVVFNSIKDNPQYAEVLCNISSPTVQDDWRIKWMELYTNTVGKIQAFPEILPSVLQFLCEQLQHERFQRVRPNAMSTAAKVNRLKFESEGANHSCSYSTPSCHLEVKIRRRAAI